MTEKAQAVVLDFGNIAKQLVKGAAVQEARTPLALTWWSGSTSTDARRAARAGMEACAVARACRSLTKPPRRSPRWTPPSQRPTKCVPREGAGPAVRALTCASVRDAPFPPRGRLAPVQTRKQVAQTLASMDRQYARMRPIPCRPGRVAACAHDAGWARSASRGGGGAGRQNGLDRHGGRRARSNARQGRCRPLDAAAAIPNQPAPIMCRATDAGFGLYIKHER